jgi:hypothetical protein
VECADGTTSEGNPPEDVFITVTKKVVIFGYLTQRNKKFGRKFKTPNGVRKFSTFPVVYKRVKTTALFVSIFSPELTSCDVESPPKSR